LGVFKGVFKGGPLLKGPSEEFVNQRDKRDNSRSKRSKKWGNWFAEACARGRPDPRVQGESIGEREGGRIRGWRVRSKHR